MALIHKKISMEKLSLWLIMERLASEIVFFYLKREVKLEVVMIKGDKDNPRETHRHKWFDVLTDYEAP